MIGYQTALRQQFKDADTVGMLEAIAIREKPSMDKLANSPSDAERNVVAGMRLDYRDRLAELKAKTLPTTSEILGGDSLPEFAH